MKSNWRVHLKQSLKLDSENRIKYGKGYIREHPDWLKKHPLGPVYWDVWSPEKELVAEAVPANEIQDFMVAKGWLILW